MIFNMTNLLIFEMFVGMFLKLARDMISFLSNASKIADSGASPNAMQTNEMLPTPPTIGSNTCENRHIRHVL